MGREVLEFLASGPSATQRRPDLSDAARLHPLAPTVRGAAVFSEVLLARSRVFVGEVGADDGELIRV